MRNWKLPTFGLAALALVWGVYLFLGHKADSTGDPEGYRGDDPSNAFVEPTEVESTEARVEPPARALAEIEAADGPQSGWLERYPKARLIEQRVVEIEPLRWRRQSLIETGVERIPYVIWEDKVVEDADGEFSYVGSAAYMGNVIHAYAAADKVDPEALQKFIEEHDLYIERESLFSGYVTLGTDNLGLGKLEELVAAYRLAFPDVIVELEVINYPADLPSEWIGSKEWALDNVLAPDAWEFETGVGKDVVVAVVDTGLQRTHPDIAPSIFLNTGEITGNSLDDDGSVLIDDVSGWDFMDNDSNPQDEDGHGTHVAGIVGATGNNGIGTSGVSWGVKVMPLKVGNRDGLRTSAIVDSLAYVALMYDKGYNIVASNNSYGSGSSSQSTQAEIAKHDDRGILFVAAAGNDGINMDSSPDALEFPAGYTNPNVISVANSNQENGLTGSSNTGLVSVDISAPGAEVYSTYPTDDYAFLSGTSMASPMVAGAIALIAAAEPDLTAAQIKERLFATADKIPSQEGRTATGARLNVLAALKPELAGHEVRIVNIDDALVFLDSVDRIAVFEVAGKAGASLSATIVEGDSIATLQDLGSGNFGVSMSQDGIARIRFTSTLQGIERSVERTLVLGEVADVRSGLLRHYGFEGSGSVATDSTGNANGTFNGPERLDTEFGKGIQLDGGSERINFQNDFTSRVTIAALVKSENLVVSAHPRIVNMPFYYMYFSSGEGSGVPDGNRQTLKFFADFEEFGVWNAPPRSIQDNRWYYVVASYDSNQIANTPDLYINGERQVVRMQQEPSGPMLSNGIDGFIGNNDDNTRPFQGLMADVRVYDRVLSQLEVEALGATLMREKWKRYKISGLPVAPVGSVVEYTLEDTGNFDSELEVAWEIDSEAGFEILSQSGGTLSVRFQEAADYQLTAIASDGVSTQFFSEEVQAATEDFDSGIYSGTTSGGGLVWLEIDPSLESGYITIFDGESGFYRFREQVVVSESGTFESVEDSAGRMIGSILGRLLGEVTGYDVSFQGEFQTPISEISNFAGTYVGGTLGLAGDRIELQVLDDGRFSLVREGPLADIGFGSISIDGSFSFESANGVTVSGIIDLDTDSVEGQIGELEFFQKREGQAARGKLFGGAIGGRPSGVGNSGLYGSFVVEGELTDANLIAGAYSRLDATDGSGPLIALQADGRSIEVGAFFGEEAQVAFASAIEANALEVGQRELQAIRTQVPVNAEGAGVIAFEIQGEEPREILIRGLGPSFSGAVVQDPSIQLFAAVEGEAVLLSTNGDWREGILFTQPNENSQGAFRSLRAGFEALGLAVLEDDAKDAAMRVWLAPGQYFVLVGSAEGDVGSGLLEVFEL